MIKKMKQAESSFVGYGKFLIYRINKIIVSVIRDYQNLQTQGLV